MQINPIVNQTIRLITSTLVCLLAACGGGSGSSEPVTTMSEINTPLVTALVTTVTPATPDQIDAPSLSAQCDTNKLSNLVKTSFLDSRGINYPAVVRSIEDPNQVLMFTGNFAHLANEAMLASTPEGRFSHINFPRAQEEIWLATLDRSRTAWAEERRYAIGIQPGTEVNRWNNLPYSQIYPKGFNSTCYNHFQNGQCNVQINDASVIIYTIDGQPHYLLYFTLFENYRWWSNELGTIDANGPEFPNTQNIQAIGLATSRDGREWQFIDKVIMEDEFDTQGNPILGAWSPSALVDPETGLVDVYFHDALGTSQYVAHFIDGINLLGIDRLNQHDQTYRANLDVIFLNGRYEVMYNNGDYAVAQTSFIRDFGLECPEKIVIPATNQEMFPTPHQFIDNGRLFLYYWDFHNDQQIIVKTYDLGS